MKVLVIKPYTDKYTVIHHMAGEVIEIGEERFKEIQVAGEYLQPIEEKKEIKTRKEK